MSSELLLKLLDDARKAGATAADAVYGESLSISSGMRMGKPEQLERAESKGVGLRVFVGQRVASVSGSDLSPPALAKLATQAVAMAKASTEDPFAGLAPADVLCQDPPALDLDDPQEPSAQWLHEQCAQAEEASLAVPGVTNSEGAEAGYSRSRMMLATSGGFLQGYASSSFSLSVTALAGGGTSMERDYDFASVRHRGDLPSPAQLGKWAGERATARINPCKPATQTAPVIYDPRVSRLLVASFAGAANGASVARGTSFLKHHLGKKLFASGIAIVDDPHRTRGLASRPFDGEGVTTSRCFMVEDGVLAGWLLDARSARQLDMRPTGHASRGLSSGPSPAPSNRFI